MRTRTAIIFVALLALISVVSAQTTNITAGMSVTCKGVWPLVSLGIEKVVSVSQAQVYYNWISIGLLFGLGAMSSRYTTRFFALLVPIFAGMLVFFQWLNGPSATQTWGIIVVCSVIAAAIYMKDSLHETFGIAGPGSLMFNVLYYIIILQSIVGFVNTTAIWEVNTAPTNSNQYTNIDLSSQVQDISGRGGESNVITQVSAIILDMTIVVIKMFCSMALALIAFSAVIAIVFPWIWPSAYGPAMLGFLQLGIYIIYYMAYMRFIYKPLGEGDF